MDDLYKIVFNVINTEDLEEARKKLFGFNIFSYVSKANIKRIVSLFVGKKDSIIEKKSNGNTHFDFNNFNDLWSILFFVKAIDFDNIINQEIIKTSDQSLKSILGSISNASNVVIDNLPASVDINTKKEIKKAVKAIHVIRNCFSHVPDSTDYSVTVNLYGVKIEIPIAYMIGFYEDKMIALDNHKNIVDEVNNIFINLGIDYRTLNNFYFNVEPDKLAYLFSVCENPLEDIKKFPEDIFIRFNTYQEIIYNILQSSNNDKLSDNDFVVLNQNSININKPKYIPDEIDSKLIQLVEDLINNKNRISNYVEALNCDDKNFKYYLPLLKISRLEDEFYFLIEISSRMDIVKKIQKVVKEMQFINNINYEERNDLLNEFTLIIDEIKDKDFDTQYIQELLGKLESTIFKKDYLNHKIKKSIKDELVLISNELVNYKPNYTACIKVILGINNYILDNMYSSLQNGFNVYYDDNVLEVKNNFSRNVLQLLTNHTTEELAMFPASMLYCEKNLFDIFYENYNACILESLFGLDNPKLLAALLYGNSVLVNYDKENNRNDDSEIKLLNGVDFSLLYQKSKELTKQYKHNIDRFNNTNFDLEFERQFTTNDRNDSLRDSSSDEEEIINIQKRMMDHLRNALAHLRVKPVYDSNGKVDYNKIYIFNQINNSSNHNFDIIMNISDFIELVRAIHIGLGLSIDVNAKAVKPEVDVVLTDNDKENSFYTL